MPVFRRAGKRWMLDVLWSGPTAMAVRDVQAALAKERDLAYTVTVMMDSLAKKGPA
ncbi:MAG: hypothetical protein R2719_04105 [Micropruina sp.]